jgi:F-type H+-transporting ATPase subunit b
VGLLQQIQNLILASLPTTIIAFLFFLFARSVFFRPITRVLAERAARTEGAKSDASRLDGQAQEKMSMYHRALDKVRAEIYSEQETARRAALEQRASIVRESRARSTERVREAKERLDKELAAVRGQVEAETGRLAEEAARAVLAETRPTRVSMGEV